MLKNILSFNHIDASLPNDEVEKLQNIFKTYHRKCWCYKKAFKRYKCIRIAITTSSMALSCAGIVSTAVTSNPICISIIGAGVAIQGLYKKIEFTLQNKKAMCKFAAASYKKILNNIVSCLRGKQYNTVELLAEWASVDNILVDIAPILDKFERYYYKKYSARAN